MVLLGRHRYCSLREIFVTVTHVDKKGEKWN